MKRAKWWLYTVLLGLLPFIVRFFIYTVHKKSPNNYYLNEVDVVTFGLVLIISTLSELDEQPNISKTLLIIVRAVSVLLLILLSVCLGFSYLIEFDNLNQFDKKNLLILAVATTVAALSLSLTIFYNPNFRDERADT